MRQGLSHCQKWVVDNVDPVRYAAIEAQFGRGKHRKYLDLPRYVRHKFSQMHRFGAHKGAPQRRILDIGCGPGHLGLVARYGGHEILGLDLPLKEPHLYSALCEVFRVAKIEHRVEPFQPLPRVGPFDRITATTTKFDLEPLWGVEEWRYFLADARTLLRAGGQIFVTLTSSKRRSPAVFDYFKGRARWTNGRRGFLL